MDENALYTFQAKRVLFEGNFTASFNRPTGNVMYVPSWD